MKRIIALLLSMVILLTGCGQSAVTVSESLYDKAFTEEISTEAISVEDADDSEEASDTEKADNIEDNVQFDSLSDEKLLTYLEDTVYADLENEFQSDDHIIENINSVYISKEYLEEVAYNSQSNIWFGYTMEEVDEQFEGTPYVFTMADDGSTEVVPFVDYDDTYDKVIRNGAIGTGVILICVTVSVVTGGIGAVPISMIFAASAKTATAMALSSGVISGVMAGAITGVQTGDFDKAIKAVALQGSEGFKWGAITGAIAGAVAGGVGEASALRNASNIADDAATATENAANVADDAVTAT